MPGSDKGRVIEAEEREWKDRGGREKKRCVEGVRSPAGSLPDWVRNRTGEKRDAGRRMSPRGRRGAPLLVMYQRSVAAEMAEELCMSGSRSATGVEGRADSVRQGPESGVRRRRMRS